jgi:hypothetical protein
MRSVEMRPAFPMDDHGNRAVTDSKLFTQGHGTPSLGCKQPDRAHLFGRQRCCRIALTVDPAVRVSSQVVLVSGRQLPLTRRILHVLSVRTGIQMRWPNASGVIAPWAVMADFAPGWHRPVCQQPRDGVRLGRAPSAVAVRPIEEAVAVFGSSHPRPATIRVGTIDLRPETLFERRTPDRLVAAGLRLAAPLRGQPRDVADGARQRCTANRAETSVAVADGSHTSHERIAAPLAKAGCAKIRGHRLFTPGGVTGPDVRSVAALSRCLNYTVSLRVEVA